MLFYNWTKQFHYFVIVLSNEFMQSMIDPLHDPVMDRGNSIVMLRHNRKCNISKHHPHLPLIQIYFWYHWYYYIFTHRFWLSNLFCYIRKWLHDNKFSSAVFIKIWSDPKEDIINGSRCLSLTTWHVPCLTDCQSLAHWCQFNIYYKRNLSHRI